MIQFFISNISRTNVKKIFFLKTKLKVVSTKVRVNVVGWFSVNFWYFQNVYVDRQSANIKAQKLLQYPTVIKADV